MPRIAISGHTIHYQQAGAGGDIVLIHGLLGNIAFWWFSLVPHLTKTHRVTALDLRGHGFSAVTPSGYRAVDLADDVAALMAGLNISNAHLVGHSFGGAVSLALAARKPELVGRLTLADAWLPSAGPLPRAARPWSETRQRLMARGIEVEQDMPHAAQGLFEELLDAPVGVGQGGGIAMLGGSSRAVRRWRELMKATSAYREIMDPAGLSPMELRRIRTPTHILSGARSRYRQNAAVLSRLLPNRTQAVIPGAGHYFPLLRPQAMLSAMALPAPGRTPVPAIGAAQ